MTGFWKSIKTKEIFYPVSSFISQSIHWSVIIRPYADKAHIEGVQRRILDQID